MPPCGWQQDKAPRGADPIGDLGEEECFDLRGRGLFVWGERMFIFLQLSLWDVPSPKTNSSHLKMMVSQ